MVRGAFGCWQVILSLGGLRAHNFDCNRLLNTKITSESRLYWSAWIGDRRLHYEQPGEHHEHVVNLETGEATEFNPVDFEALKERIAREMSHKLVEEFGLKLKSCPLVAKLVRCKIPAHRHVVAVCLYNSFSFCSPQKGPGRFVKCEFTNIIWISS